MNISTAQEEPADCEKILLTLKQMCADGWVAFDWKTLRKNLPLQWGPKFTGDVIVGIVKPYIEKQEWSKEILERQVQTMVLMRAFRWRLREYESRNWINGCLVDGADVETRVSEIRYRYLDRSWWSVFYSLIKEAKELAASNWNED